MKLQTVIKLADLIIQQKLLIIHQQELAANLSRAPSRRLQAGQARAKLLLMINRLDLMQEVDSPQLASTPVA